MDFSPTLLILAVLHKSQENFRDVGRTSTDNQPTAEQPIKWLLMLRNIWLVEPYRLVSVSLQVIL